MGSGRRWIGAGAALALCWASCGSLAAQASSDAVLTSGQYGDLLLAIDPASGDLTAHQRADWVGNGTEARPQFTCVFALRGTPVEAGQYAVVVREPGRTRSGACTVVTRGKLVKTGAGVTLTLERVPGLPVPVPRRVG